MIRLTIDMPRWLWWLALRAGLVIAVEVEGEPLRPFDLVKHGRPLSLLYRADEQATGVEARLETRPAGAQAAVEGPGGADRERMALAALR